MGRTGYSTCRIGTHPTHRPPRSIRRRRIGTSQASATATAASWRRGSSTRFSGRRNGGLVFDGSSGTNCDTHSPRSSRRAECRSSCCGRCLGKVTCQEVVVTEKRTTAPKRFTEPSLIQAMIGIARYVTDPKIKQLLRETDGIGTPATQANIIETLFERRFVERRGRQIISTTVGRALVAALPDPTTRPDMTALWEASIRQIADGQAARRPFLSSVEEELRNLIARDRPRARLEVPPKGSTARSEGDGRRRAHRSSRRRP